MSAGKRALQRCSLRGVAYDEETMILTDFLRALGRRWYVLVVGIIATAGLAIGAYIVSPPVYTARGLVMLLPSQVAVDGGNPFLELGNLDLPARVLVSYFQSEPAQTQVEKVAPDAKYVVSIEESTRGPIIAIDVKDSTPDGTLSTLAYIADAIPTNLARLQTEVGAPETSFVRSIPLTMDEQASEDLSGTVRVVVAAGVAGLVASLIVTFLVDRALLGSGRRRGQETEDEDEDEDEDDLIEPDVDEPFDEFVESTLADDHGAEDRVLARTAARRAKR
jgi:hypothetical protein